MIPTAIDLFCGCGGTTTGLKRAGFRVVGAVDNNPEAIEAYGMNHPEVAAVCGDIRQMDPVEFAAKVGVKPGELALLVGCPPCQGFSQMRTHRKSVCVADERNDLIFEFFRFVESLRPRAVMVENVPGFAKYPGFHVFAQKMQELGYCGSHRIVDAAEYGVPQRRRRCIYLAGLGGYIVHAEGRGGRRTVREAIGWLPKAGESGDPLHDVEWRAAPKVMALIRAIPRNGGDHAMLPDSFFESINVRRPGFGGIYGRLPWDDVAPTITGGCVSASRGRYLHPEEDRPMTLREAAILQGFPADYHFPAVAKSKIAKMIGNAVPPALAEAHARGVASFLRGESADLFGLAAQV